MQAPTLHSPSHIRLNLSEKFINKECLAEPKWNNKDNEYNTAWAYGYTFYPKHIKIDDWIAHIQSGKAFTMGYYEGNTRRKETFVSAQIVGLDFDKDVSVADCLANSFIVQNAALIYATPSSTREHPKTRVMFVLDSAVTTVATWERLQRALIWAFNELSPDPSCKDAARLFYGSNKGESVVLSHVLAVAVLEPLAVQMEAELGTLQPERTTEDNTRIREQNRANIADDKKRTRYYNYASIALDNACQNISMASDGERHSMLFRCSANIGNHIGAGMISESECFNALVGAYRGKDNRREIERTVGDALRAGISKPTDTYELDRQWDEKVKQWKKEWLKQRENEIPQDLFGRIIHEAETQKVAESRILTHLHNTYEHQSWFAEHIPFAYLCAVLHLTDSRSETAVIFLKLHGAFLYGLLNSGSFTIQDVMNAYPQFSRKIIRTALDDLEEMNFITDLNTLSTTKVVSKDRVKKSQAKRGRPPKQYMICNAKTLLDRIPIRLKQALEIYYREKFQHDVISELTPQMAMQLGIEDYETLKAVRNATKIGMQQDKLSKEAAWRFKQEMEGDGRDWRGWEYAFASGFIIPLDHIQINSVRDLRAAIIRYWITEVREDNTQTELTRLIGCSSATLGSIYRDYDIATTKQYHRETLTPEQVGGDLRLTFQRLQQKYRGVIWEVKFKHYLQKGWQTCKVEHAAMHYAMHVDDKEHPIEGVLIMLVLPSHQHVMTPKEIAQRDKEQVETDTKQAKPITTVTSKPVQRKAMKPSRQWLGHDFEYLYQWTQTFTFVYSDSLELQGNSIVDTTLYAPAHEIHKTDDLGDVLRYVVSQNPLLELKRSSADYRGIDDHDYNAEVSAYFKQKHEDEMASYKTQELEKQDDMWFEIYRQADLIEVPEFD